MGNYKKFFAVCSITLLLEIVGIVGFVRFEGISYRESTYQTTMIMLAHFDHYGFKHARSRALVVILVIASLLLIAYLLKLLAEYMIGIGDNVKKQRMQAKINRLRHHYIVCGWGRVGAQVARELSLESASFVVVDHDQKRVDEALHEGFLALHANSMHEKSLNAVGIGRAEGLIACLGDDSENLLVTLAARTLNPELYIVARVNSAENQPRLKQAGADRVAMPYQIGGYHMANMAIRPNVVDYMDVISSKGKSDLEVEEMVVGDNSGLAGHRLGSSLANADIKGATVIAINGSDGISRVNPSGKEIIYPGDRLIVLGAKKDLTAASALIR